jgi:EmrB/QacA subfamily drug resistance transporter
MTAPRPFSYTVPAIIGCALFMELLDATAVLTALPQMAAEFGEPAVRMNLVVSLYMLAAALFVPISGWAADRFGPRKVFICAIVLFMFSSLACALSSSLLQLSLARLLQGGAGAMMVPVGQVLLLRWSTRENLLKAMSFLAIPGLLGPVLGPPLGGLLVTYLSWEWIFLINLPIGLFGLLLVWRFVPAYPPLSTAPLDARGLLLSGSGLACLVFGFESLGHGLLDRRWVMLLVAIGLLACWLYVRHARRVKYPLIDLELLRIPSFGSAIRGGSLFRLGSAAQPFLLVLLFQVCFAFSALQAGLLIFAGGVGALLMKFLSVRIVSRIGYRQSLLVSTLGGGALIGLCALLRVDTPYLLVILLLGLAGMVRSLQFSALGALTYIDVPVERMSRASSLSAMAVQLGMGLAVGLASIVLNGIMALRGHQQVQVGDLSLVILLTALLCVAAALVFRRLDEPAVVASVQPATRPDPCLVR